VVTFRVDAINPKGEAMRVEVEAESVQDAIQKARQRGLFPTSVAPARPGTAGPRLEGLTESLDEMQRPHRKRAEAVEEKHAREVARLRDLARQGRTDAEGKLAETLLDHASDDPASEQGRSDLAEAAGLAMACSRRGEEAGYRVMAACLENGWGGLRKDLKMARLCCEQAAAANTPEGRFCLGSFLFRRTWFHRRRGLQMMRDAAENGSADLKADLALLLMKKNPFSHEGNAWLEKADLQAGQESNKVPGT
jgi:TPR repeat protein